MHFHLITDLEHWLSSIHSPSTTCLLVGKWNDPSLGLWLENSLLLDMERWKIEASVLQLDMERKASVLRSDMELILLHLAQSFHILITSLSRFMVLLYYQKSKLSYQSDMQVPFFWSNLIEKVSEPGDLVCGVLIPGQLCHGGRTDHLPKYRQ